MRVLLFIPPAIVTRCFTEEDLHRLRSAHEVRAVAAAGAEAAADAWARHAGEAEVVITGWHTPPLTDAMLEAAPQLRLILHAAGSVKHLCPPSVWTHGIRVATANEALSIGVAETTLGMIIAGLKGIFPASRFTHAGGWKQDDFCAANIPIRDVYGSTIGVIGASQAGRHLIRLLRQFEVDVLLADPTIDAAEAARLGVRLVPLPELMQHSDVISLHAPALPETRRLLGRREFALMRDGAIFINTARGMIVDETALADELRTGRLWAFIDVVEHEPPPADHPFRTLPNVVLTPHIAGAVAKGCSRMGRQVLRQLGEYQSAQPMTGEVSEDRLAIMA